jgi:hypothetical protein
VSTNGHVDPEDIAEEMMGLLSERLQDPERRAKISDTVAAKFFAEANKLAERKKASEKDTVVAPTDVLDIIQGSDIDIAHKDLLVNREIARLEEKLLLLRAAKEDRYGERRGLLQGEQADEERGVLVFQPVAV